MKKYKVAILSNVTIDLIAAQLKRNFDVYTPGGFDNWIQEAMNSDSEMYRFEPNIIFLLLDGIECRTWSEGECENRIAEWKIGINSLVVNYKNVPVVLPVIDFRNCNIKSLSEKSFLHIYEHEWYKYIFELIDTYNNVFYYDIKDTISNVGRDNFFSDKMWYFGNSPYSRIGISSVVNDITQIIHNVFSAAKKLIVLDLDNTLWGGVIGEDGLDGIELSNHKEGQRFYDFQLQLLEMKKRGALLAINTKNNIEDVDKVLDNHPYMVLKKDDFVAIKANWNNKAQNIKELSEELNITEGSFVFIDDNPIERSIVAGECPEITVLEYPKDTTQLIRFAESFYNEHFRQKRVLKDDADKTIQYITEKQRQKDRDSCINLDEYIKLLEIEADIHRMKENELERVCQLCNKTNQFNLTTKRYTEQEIAEFANSADYDVFVTYTRDKYGDNGLVSVLITKRSGKTVMIDTFLMSCRVMGRKLENVIISELLSYYKSQGIDEIESLYLRTAKNTPVESLYDRLGFERISEDEEKHEYSFGCSKFQDFQETCYKHITFTS